MTTYIWEIESLDCVLDGESKVVSSIHWRLKGDDGTNTAEIYGVRSIENNTKTPFIVYEALTKEEVIKWLEDSMGVDAVTELQEALNSQLEGLTNPPVITPPLPWLA